MALVVLRIVKLADRAWLAASKTIRKGSGIEMTALLFRLGMERLLFGLVLRDQASDSVQGLLVREPRGQCFVVRYLLVQLRALFTH